MSGEQDLALAGIRAINDMDIEDIEEILDWLDEATAAFRTVLAVKRIISKRPRGLELPPRIAKLMDVEVSLPRISENEQELEPIELPRDRNGKFFPGALTDGIAELLQKHEYGLSVTQLMSVFGVSYATVYNTLCKSRNTKFVQATKGIWMFCDGNPEVIAEIGRAHYTKPKRSLEGTFHASKKESQSGQAECRQPEEEENSTTTLRAVGGA